MPTKQNRIQEECFYQASTSQPCSLAQDFEAQDLMSGAMSPPLVSVITPFFNATRWLPGLVNVTKTQTLTVFEHILVDDCSTDGSKPLAESLTHGDARYKVLQMSRNGGPAAARNLGLSVAKGRYVAFLDADDLWLPGKLEQQTRFMQERGHAFTYHDYRFISEDSSHIGKLVRAPDLLDVPTLHTRRGVGCLAVMIDRDKLPGFKFPEVDRTFPEDHFAWFTILKGGERGHRLPQDLARYRVFKGSRSSNKLKAAGAMWLTFRYAEGLPLPRASYWWLRYTWAAFRLHRYAQPHFRRSDTVETHQSWISP